MLPTALTEGDRFTLPVVAGSSHSSQRALERVFGLGREQRGVLEVRWPGGIRNRLYDVKAGDRVTMPEIPCSFDGDFDGMSDYLDCVVPALQDLRDAGVLTAGEAARLQSSAIRAFTGD